MHANINDKMLNVSNNRPDFIKKDSFMLNIFFIYFQCKCVFHPCLFISARLLQL